MALGVRNDTSPAATSGTDGDYEPFQFFNGAMWVTPWGNVAHDAADSGNPLKFGAKAKSPDGTVTSVVAEDDRTDLYADLNGRLFVNTHAPEKFSASFNGNTAQTNTALKAAPGASHQLMVTDVVISANGAANTIKLVEDTGGTPADVLEVLYIAADDVKSVHFQTPIAITANKDVGFTSTVANNHSITISGYIADV